MIRSEINSKEERCNSWRIYKENRRTYGRASIETVDALSRYNTANSNYRNYSRLRQSQYEKKLVGLLSTAPKAFHGYLRERKKGCPSVGPLFFHLLVPYS